MLRRVGPAFVVGGSFVLALAGAWAQTPMAGVAAPAPQLTAQDRLDAIRQSLVDAALHSPTRVYTTSSPMTATTPAKPELACNSPPLLSPKPLHRHLGKNSANTSP